MELNILYDDIIKYFRFGSLEKRLKYFDTLNISEGDTVMDCGSYFGSNTVYLSRKVGNKGKVISIEADPNNFNILIKNIEYFKSKNVIPLNIAISNKRGFEYIYQSLDGSSANSIVKESSKVVNIPYEKTRCDTFLNIIKRCRVKDIHFIYLNIEGSEYYILKDIEEIINRYRPIWVMHDHEKYLKNHNSSEIDSIFNNHSYKIIEEPFKTFIPYE